MKKIICLIILFLISAVIFANDLSNMYNRSDLEYWQGRYPQHIRWNFENLILANITNYEKQAIGNVNLLFPLFGQGESKESPLTYYRISNSIVMPIFSIKFFDDICIALAWLELNGYSTMTVWEYIAMLKYRPARDFPNGCFPTPFRALRIPDNALDNSSVDKISKNALKSAIIWILAHELGHIRYDHPAYSSISIERAQANEEQADSFATEIMRRIGIAPVGMSFLFLLMFNLDVIREDFNNQESWLDYLNNMRTHPLTANRLRLLALDLRDSANDFTKYENDKVRAVARVYSISDQINKLAGIVNYLSTRKNILQKALAADLDMLKPRRSGEMIASDIIETPDIGLNEFQGYFKGVWIQYNNKGRKIYNKIFADLIRTGNHVTGKFGFQIGVGEINGIIRGNKLEFEWKWSASKGNGVLEILDQSGKLKGTLGYMDSQSGAGIWELHR